MSIGDYSKIPIEVQLHVIAEYLPLADIHSLRQTNSRYRTYLKDEDIKRTKLGSREAFDLAIVNDDPSLLERFFQVASLELQEKIYRSKYLTKGQILDFRDRFYSKLLVDAALQDKPRIAVWLAKNEGRFEYLEMYTPNEVLKICNLVLKYPSIARTLDEFALDEIGVALIEDGRRADALQLTSSVVRFMNLDYMQRLVWRLFYPDDNTDIGLQKASVLIDVLHNPELRDVLLAILGGK